LNFPGVASTFLKGAVAAQPLPSNDKFIVIVVIDGNSVLLRPAYHPPTRLPRPPACELPPMIVTNAQYLSTILIASAAG
jgi:hypothetical protein